MVQRGFVLVHGALPAALRKRVTLLELDVAEVIMRVSLFLFVFLRERGVIVGFGIVELAEMIEWIPYSFSEACRPAPEAARRRTA
jgi:hypothetical protein